MARQSNLKTTTIHSTNEQLNARIFPFKDGIGESISTEWYPDRNKKHEKHYNFKKGVEDGLWIEWYPTVRKN